MIKYSFLHLWPQVYLTLMFLPICYSDAIIPNVFTFLDNITSHNFDLLRGRSLLISWGWGGGWAILGGSWKKFYPKWGGQNFIYESIGGGAQIWFPFPFLASKCSGFWGASPQTPSHIINFFIFHVPLFTTTTEKWRLEEICICLVPSVRSFCGNAHCHLIMQVQTNAYRHMGSILTSYWYFVEQNEMPEWNQLWDWAFQQAYVTRNQWTYTLTRIMFAENHHKFQCMYVSESS